jgi:hypothetical protein
MLDLKFLLADLSHNYIQTATIFKGFDFITILK